MLVSGAFMLVYVCEAPPPRMAWAWLWHAVKMYRNSGYTAAYLDTNAGCLGRRPGFRRLARARRFALSSSAFCWAARAVSAAAALSSAAFRLAAAASSATDAACDARAASLAK